MNAARFLRSSSFNIIIIHSLISLTGVWDSFCLCYFLQPCASLIQVCPPCQLNCLPVTMPPPKPPSWRRHPMTQGLLPLEQRPGHRFSITRPYLSPPTQRKKKIYQLMPPSLPLHNTKQDCVLIKCNIAIVLNRSMKLAKHHLHSNFAQNSWDSRVIVGTVLLSQRFVGCVRQGVLRDLRLRHFDNTTQSLRNGSRFGTHRTFFAFCSGMINGLETLLHLLLQTVLGLLS